MNADDHIILSRQTKLLLWLAFALYAVVLTVAMANHELWGDELQAWNIARDSSSFAGLIANTRYEGHPPAWFVLLWLVSKVKHDPAYMQVLQAVISCAVVFLLLFKSPLPIATRILLPFGYYFLFEYGVLSRNYMIAVLVACCLCLVMWRRGKYQLLLYYALVILMTNIHLLAIPLAAGLHLYFLQQLWEQRQGKKVVAVHAVLGILIAIPGLYRILPPSDSQINTHFWLSRWNAQRIPAFVDAPLQAFIPLPAWWKAQFWNTELITEARNMNGYWTLPGWLLSVATVVLAIYVLKGNRRSLLLFVTAFVLTLLLAISFFPLSSARYAGFLFISFVIAYWLYCREAMPIQPKRIVVSVILVVQLAAGIFAVARDIQMPFSHFPEVKGLLREVPREEQVACDYWALNAAAAFIDQSFYCVDLQKQASFNMWNSEAAAAQQNKQRYCNGVHNLFLKEHIDEVYLLSTFSPPQLQQQDAQLFLLYQVQLKDKREGAIERSSNLYLYHIKAP